MIALPHVLSFRLLLGLIQLIDEGKLTVVIMVEKNRVAIVSSADETVLCHPVTSKVGQVTKLDSGHPREGANKACALIRIIMCIN